jgi:aromatic-L-amino-acid/L-tryptophan decarboxylase
MELAPEELQELGQRVVAFITHYLQTLPDQSTQPEGLNPEALHKLLDEPLPRQPQGVDFALQDFINKVAANSTRIGHPRFMGWIRTSPLGAAIYAEALAAALNQSVAVWDGAPSATEVELRVIEWLKEMSGYASQAGGLLTSGGSMANFICLLAARSAADPLAREQGLANRPPFTLYITEETHYCVLKAAEMMGIGRRNVRFVPIDAGLRMKPVALAQQIRSDRETGFRPLAVVATLGTVNTGACDDLLALGKVCREQGVWLHVDGAYGGLSALLPEKRPLAAGLAEADSLVFDPHKGLFMPFEAGCALVREPCHLHEAFAVEADYLPNTEPCNPQGPIHFRDYGPQLSRNFRALKVYLALKTYGVDAIASEMSRLYSLAGDLGRRLQSADDFELLAPVTLGIVPFRYTPATPPSEMQPANWLNELNSRIVAEVQRRGRVFISGTRIRETVTLRACFVSFRTQPTDLDILLDEIRSVGKSFLQE